MTDFLNVGNAGFSNVKNGLYVDKTSLISFINSTLNTMDKLTCVSRPRRFGKSYAAKMLCAYYDKSCDSSHLFDDLEIANDPSYKIHLNKYDVIYLDIIWFITNAEHIYDTVKNIQTEVIADLSKSYPDVPVGSTLAKTISNITNTTGNQFIIIIDEWDALFREAKHDTALLDEYIKLLRSLFKSSMTEKMIIGAYLTGILPIKKYGTHSALTGFREFTMTTPKKLASYVGFTEAEVKHLCDAYHMDFSEMKHWYDGYSFSRIKSVYSPNSVIEAIQNEEFGSYWTQTETYESLKLYIDMDLDGLKEAIVQMLGGAHYPINTRTFQNDMTNIQSKDDVLTLLIHLGYLAYNGTEKTVYIPNEEIRQEFVCAVEEGKHQELANLIRTSEYLLRETLNMNADAVASAIEKTHNFGTAPLFYNDEQALRSVIKFAYISCIDEFMKIEELPSGHGYADIVYLPKQGSGLPILIIELKWNKTAEGAIKQIKDKSYPQVLENYGNDILLVGINYDEKTKKHSCVIEKVDAIR
jgi:hypothetical protein